MFPVFVVLFGFVALVFVIVGYTTNPSTLNKDKNRTDKTDKS